MRGFRETCKGPTKAPATTSFLSRLRNDKAGNTIAMAAAAIVPLVGLVGGAVDVSRYYMSVTRIQNACDAGALAARKEMGDDTWTTADQTIGQNFFDQNFPEGSFGTTGLIRSYSADNEGKVIGTATAKMPVTLMQVFGFGDFDLNVSCTADINISNTDIVFVLDVTGSMNCPDTSPGCGNNGNVESSTALIKGLRTAVMSFYDTVEASTSAAAQVRYGIVPYASNVNVGFAIPSQYMAASHTYQTRVPQITTKTEWVFQSYNITSVYNKGAEYRNGSHDVSTHYGVNSSSACSNLMPSSPISDTFVGGSIENGSLVQNSQTVSGNTRTTNYNARGTFFRGQPAYGYDASRRRCYTGWARYDYKSDFTFDYVETSETTETFDNWIYKPHSYDVSNFYSGGTVTTPTGYQGADVVHGWTGCIEEASTAAVGTFDPIPANAYDLDINLKPATEQQKWKPQLPLAMYKRESGYTNVLNELTQTWDENQPGYDCPKPAARLTDMSRSFLEDYLKASNGFDARGSTYHDIGMIWGGRFISPNGIFGADNSSAPNGDAIARHIVFMTDGLLEPNNETYTPYGIEWWDRRISGNGDNNTAKSRHRARFLAACKAAKQENISVWVVAFGTTLSQDLIDCATPGRAVAASNSAQLQTKFNEIAEKIAALRLVS